MNTITNRHSIIYKLLSVFFISIFMPTILICTMYYNVVSINYENNLLTSFEIILNQYINSADYRLERYKETMEFLSCETAVLKLSENPDPVKMFDLSAKHMPNMMSEGHIFRCTLFTRKSSADMDYSYEKIKDEKWFGEYVEKKRYGKWFFNKTPGRSLPLISIVYPVWQTTGGSYSNPNAVIKLDLFLENVVEEIFPKKWDESFVDCVLFTEDKEIIWQKGAGVQEINRLIYEYKDIDTLSTEIIKTNYSDGIVRCKKIGNQNIYIICKMSKSYIKNTMIKEQNYF